ncbi:basic salivary proline-rich protein 2-like [Trachemys scripta elegans]|uniref:basic salivary proline-rich protein 2-like n=1 Tax=Trachemys scripta elegans TaxID=31138 RepID=UPI0015571C8C|nr:basic salivary proline-rich protein 2-like [Trachemys scripta elegans]
MKRIPAHGRQTAKTPTPSALKSSIFRGQGFHSPFGFAARSPGQARHRPGQSSQLHARGSESLPTEPARRAERGPGRAEQAATAGPRRGASRQPGLSSAPLEPRAPSDTGLTARRRPAELPPLAPRDQRVRRARPAPPAWAAEPQQPGKRRCSPPDPLTGRPKHRQPHAQGSAQRPPPGSAPRCPGQLAKGDHRSGAPEPPGQPLHAALRRPPARLPRALACSEPGAAAVRASPHLSARRTAEPGESDCTRFQARSLGLCSFFYILMWH